MFEAGMVEGCITALITPFRDGKVDVAAVDRLVDAQLRGGVSGVVVCGTTGESPTLSREEQRSLLRQIVKRVAGRTKVWMGTGSYSTEDAVRRTCDAAGEGADGVLVVSPFYNRPTMAGVRAHFLAIADASPVPVMLYDIPSRTGTHIGPKLSIELAKHERIVAVKDAAGVLGDTMTMVDGGLAVLSGDDANTLPWMSIGARGVVSVASNVVPGQISALVAEASKGDFTAARLRHFRLLPLMRALFLESNPAPVKALLESMGMCTAQVRLPLVGVSSGTREAVIEAYRSVVGPVVGAVGR